MSGETQNIAVIGAGSWGTALALGLAYKQHQISLWGHQAKHCQTMQAERANNQYLPGFAFPDNLIIEPDLKQLVKQHRRFLVVVPSHAFRSTLQQLKQHNIPEDAHIVWATKGFDQQGPSLLSAVVEQELGASITMAIVSGPSFSKEVAAKLPTAITAAGSSMEISREVAGWFQSDAMRVYANPDFIGVQVGGAIKNVMAIAAGISDGLGFGANSRAAIITRGLAEIARLGVALGAKHETFTGLAGMGDLILTCTDNQSRNRQFGLALGQGKSVQQALGSISQEVEGYTTTPEVIRLAKNQQIEMPISEQVYQVLYHELPAQTAVKALLSRNAVDEY